jgi:hypothetical protein
VRARSPGDSTQGPRWLNSVLWRSPRSFVRWATADECLGIRDCYQLTVGREALLSDNSCQDVRFVLVRPALLAPPIAASYQHRSADLRQDGDDRPACGQHRLECRDGFAMEILDDSNPLTFECRPPAGGARYAGWPGGGSLHGCRGAKQGLVRWPYLDPRCVAASLLRLVHEGVSRVNHSPELVVDP